MKDLERGFIGSGARPTACAQYMLVVVTIPNKVVNDNSCHCQWQGQRDKGEVSVELTSGCVLDSIRSTVRTDLACCSSGYYKEFAQSGGWMPATEKAVNRAMEEDSVMFISPLSAEVVKGWSSRKLPANFYPAGFCAG